MVATQTNSPASDFIDLNGDGIDDRLQLGELSWFAQKALAVRALFVKPHVAPLAPPTLAALCAQVQAAPARALVAPANPINKDPDGYEYRSVDARVWASRAFMTETVNHGADMSAVSFALASEAPAITKYPAYSLAIGEAIVNAAHAASISVHARVTMDGVKVGGKLPKAAGHYGRQSGRWCASLQWPTAQHVAAAQLVLERPAMGHGAARWFDCRVMDHGFQAGARLSYDAAGLMEKWGAEGWELADPLAEIDPYALALMVFKGRGKADVMRGLAAVHDGRARWGVRI